MKTKTLKTLLVAAITMAAMSMPGTANAQLGGLVNKAKKKAEQVVDKKKEDVKKEALCVLPHRIILVNQSHLDNVRFLENMLDEVPVPLEKP